MEVALISESEFNWNRHNFGHEPLGHVMHFASRGFRCRPRVPTRRGSVWRPRARGAEAHHASPGQETAAYSGETPGRAPEVHDTL